MNIRAIYRAIITKLSICNQGSFTQKLIIEILENDNVIYKKTQIIKICITKHLLQQTRLLCTSILIEVFLYFKRFVEPKLKYSYQKKNLYYKLK